MVGMKFLIFILVLIFVANNPCASEKPSKSPGKSLTKTRILSEWRDILRDKLSLRHQFNQSSIDECEIRLSPLENDFLQWHFSFNGVADSSFDGGCYHGKIVLSPDYPRKAPSICVMTPNGRWEVGKEICLSGMSLLCPRYTFT